MNSVSNMNELANAIEVANQYFLKQAQRQVNTALTLRNWLIGCYIWEYEQSGKDRADYGTQLYKALADRLLQNGLKSLRGRHLYLCKDSYLAYPQILRTASVKPYLIDFQCGKILQSSSAELSENGVWGNINHLLTSLSFSHFIELLKADTEAQRRFYEVTGHTE